MKADSEGNVGPQAYNRTEADGANLLARAVAPHGGIVMWRAFVYGEGGIQYEDLARQSFDTFMPLDGKLDENVILQIKNGLVDPPAPTFAYKALQNTDTLHIEH